MGERGSATPLLPRRPDPSPDATQLLADGRRPSRRFLACGRAAACVSKPELELASLEKPRTPRPRRFSVEPPTLPPFSPFARRRPPSVRRLNSPRPFTSVQLLSQPGAPCPCASFDPRRAVRLAAVSSFAVDSTLWRVSLPSFSCSSFALMSWCSSARPFRVWCTGLAGTSPRPPVRAAASAVVVFSRRRLASASSAGKSKSW